MYKVIIVSYDQNIYVSKNSLARDQKKYCFPCYYDFETGVLGETAYQYNTISNGLIEELLCALLITLLSETVVMFFFGLQTFGNIVRLLGINIIPQAFLDLYLLYSHLLIIDNKLSFLMTILAEIVITIAEMLYYKSRLEYHNEVRQVRNVVYAVVANVASFGLGLLIL